MKRYFSLILAIAATVSAQIVPSTGNVRGPTSATDNAVARYDGTTGKLIQNSGVTIDDSGNLTVSGTGTSSVAGSLGIGTTSPGGKLDVQSASAAGNTVLFRGGSYTDIAFATGVQFLAPASTLNSNRQFRFTSGDASLTIQGIDGSGGNAGDTTLQLQPSGGNVLVGGTTNSSNGNLQLKDTSGSSTKGIGFGTDTSLFRSGNGVLDISGTAATAQIRMLQGATLKALVGNVNEDLYIDSRGSGSFILRTNGTTTALTLDSSQALRLNAYGAGTLTTDSSGNVTATSDERAKNIIGTFRKGLAEVVKLTPKTYTWKPETGLNTTDLVASLTAQDLIAAGIPEAVSTYRTVADLDDDGKQKTDADGKPLTKRIDATYTVSDRAVIAALVNAVKELNAKVAALEAARN